MEGESVVGGCGSGTLATNDGDEEGKNTIPENDDLSKQGPSNSIVNVRHRVTADMKNLVLDVDSDDIVTNIDLVEDNLYLGKINRPVIIEMYICLDGFTVYSMNCVWILAASKPFYQNFAFQYQ
jgi:hypothetical protein